MRPVLIVSLVIAALVLVLGAASAGEEADALEAAPASAAVAVEGGAAAAYAGASAGCTAPDPTGTGGCITPATSWVLTQMDAVFGQLPTSCWDAHAWNPTSDHPAGRACDVFFGRAGTFPGPDDTAAGWGLATWLCSNATALNIKYVIWQGRIWSTSRDDEGWRAYSGGGVYDASSATGGHYDHVHFSTTT